MTHRNLETGSTTRLLCAAGVVGAALLLAAAAAGSAALDARTSAPGVAAGDPSGLYVYDAAKGSLTTAIKGGKERIDLVWSPDGRWIASQNTDDFRVDVLRPGGGARRKVLSIKWSPSGSRVAYATRQGLFVGPSDWSNPSLVTTEPGSDAVDWAADGSRFVFGTGARSCCWQTIGISDADGTGAQILWTPPSDGAVAATINNAVASRGGGEFLYLVSPVGGAAKRVVYRPDVEFQAWSGDGKWLLLGDENMLYRLSPEGGTAEPVCPKGCVGPAPSPDRSRVAYVLKGVSASSFTLWVANVDGSGKSRIATVPKPDYIFWSPDARKLGLTLLAPGDKRSSAAVADLATKRVKRLTDGTRRDFLAGISSSGTLADFYRVGRTEKDPVTLWVVRTTGGKAKKVLTLASDDLGPCPLDAWSPKAAVLAIVNAACEPS